MYPDGLLIEYDGMIYKTQKETLLQLLSWKAALSWNQAILTTDKDYIENNFDISEQRLGFRPTTLIYNPGRSIYFIEGIKKRRIDRDTLERLGMAESEMYEVSNWEIDFHPEGDPVV